MTSRTRRPLGFLTNKGRKTISEEEAALVMLKLMSKDLELCKPGYYDYLRKKSVFWILSGGVEYIGGYLKPRSGAQLCGSLEHPDGWLVAYRPGDIVLVELEDEEAGIYLSFTSTGFGRGLLQCSKKVSSPWSSGPLVDAWNDAKVLV